MNILVVDDNESNLYQLQALLSGNGYHVMTAVHGAEALEKARQNPPDLIITDILMPVMDGYALCRAWKQNERLKAIPLVFYTATYTDERDRELALSLGAARFIVKPEEPAAFIKNLRELIRQETEPPSAPDPQAVAGVATRLSIERPEEEEASYLRQYNQVLIHKLEQKLEELEKANRELVRSVTERKQAETALRESSEWERALFEGSPHGILIIEVETRRFLYSNPCIRRMLGYTEEELVKLGLKDLHPAAVLAQVEAEFVALVRGENAVAEGIPCRRKDGTVFYADIAATSFRSAGRECAAGFFTDVTLRELAEEALQESEARFRSIVETTKEWIWKMDLNGRMTYSNPASEEILGYRLEELIGRNTLEYTHEADRQKIEELLPQLIAAKRGWTGLVTRWRHKDGSLRWLESNAVPVFDSQGQLAGFQGADRDITERKQAEEKLKERMEELLTWESVTLGREGRVMELKKEVNELLAERGKPPRYGDPEKEMLLS